jgi:undecaprenyl-diphosphatase
VWLSRAGTSGLIWIVLAVVAAILLRRPTLVPLVVLAVVLSDLVAIGLKQLFDVERPSVRYTEPEPLVRAPTDLSFPSGHAATSFASAALLAWAAPRFALPLYVLAGAIAFSRVYVGVHYPLDVLAGAALGLLVATALRLLPATLRGSQRAPRAG